MMLFCKSRNIIGGQLIIPSNRLINIYATDCRININYDGGEFIEIITGTFQPKIETASIIYDDPDEVEKVLRQFYKALNNHAEAFYFGGNN